MAVAPTSSYRFGVKKMAQRGRYAIFVNRVYFLRALGGSGALYVEHGHTGTVHPIWVRCSWWGCPQPAHRCLLP